MGALLALAAAEIKEDLHQVDQEGAALAVAHQRAAQFPARALLVAQAQPPLQVVVVVVLVVILFLVPVVPVVQAVQATTYLAALDQRPPHHPIAQAVAALEVEDQTAEPVVILAAQAAAVFVS